jgi:hypothetical protein
MKPTMQGFPERAASSASPSAASAVGAGGSWLPSLQALGDVTAPGSQARHEAPDPPPGRWHPDPSDPDHNIRLAECKAARRNAPLC